MFRQRLKSAKLYGHGVRSAAVGEGLPVSPSLGPALLDVDLPAHSDRLGVRVIFISFLCVLIGLAAGLVSQLLIRTIWLITNVSFFGRFSIQHVTPPRFAAENPLGLWIILIPTAGAMVIGLIARFGSRQVAGHGIPEAMEQVLTNQSRIPPKMTFLKPLSAAISIGTGGPFGAEGPIIATGGALGSLIGQLLHTTPHERKVLLSAGAAAGISAAFGCPIAAVLLAVELLLFEFSPRSLIPVALACAVAAVVHFRFEGFVPFFGFPNAGTMSASFESLLVWTALGGVMGLASVGMTVGVYLAEKCFEHLPIHWMWRPAVGGLIVGLIGYFSPRTLGSGYFNIDHLLGGELALGSALSLLLLKDLSWTLSLGSGTAGGTLAPVFTIGGALGAVVALTCHHVFPTLPMDIGMAALVGMVAIFAGASRAMLTCVVFAFETTLAPSTILPALCGCTTAYLVATLISHTSIMSEKMHRQGVRVPMEYRADLLSHLLVEEACSKPPVTLPSNQSIAATREWMKRDESASRYRGFPLLSEEGYVAGWLERSQTLDPSHSPETTLGSLLRRPAVLVYSDSTLADAIDQMVRHQLARLPVIDRTTRRLIGVISQGDIVRHYGQRVAADRRGEPSLLSRRNGAT